MNQNGTYDYGCLMINSVHFGELGWTVKDQILNPVFNATVAYAIYQERGWRAWYGVEGIYWN